MPSHKRSLIETITSSFGFLVVAFLCSGVGYYLSQNKPPTIEHALMLAVFSFSLWPYYYFREKTLEQNLQSPHVVRSDEVQVSLAFSFLTATIGVAFILWIAEPPNRVLLVSSYLISCIPFVYLGTRTVNSLKSSNQDEKQFIYRLLFPGVATCMVPLSFGWALHDNNILALAIIAAYIVVISEISRYLQMGLLRFLSIIAFTLAVAAFTVQSYQVASVLIVGIILSFGMGVAEVGKRIYLITENGRPIFDDEHKDFYIAGSNWASSVFPILLCLLPLLLIDFPAIPILLYSGSYILLWQVMIRNKATKTAFNVSIFMGYALPVTIISSRLFFKDSHFLNQEILASLTFLLGLFALIFGIAARVIGADRFTAIVTKEFRINQNYLRHDFIFWILAVSVCTTIVIVEILVPFLQPADVKMAASYKITASEIISGLFAIFAIRGLIVWGEGGLPNSGTGGNNDLANNTSAGGTQALKALLSITRPLVSIVPGVFVVVAMCWATPSGIINSLVCGIPIILVTMFGFVVNDIIDKDKDRIACANKPLALGVVTSRSAVILGAILTLALVAVETTIGNEQSHIVAIAIYAGVSLYSHLARIIPVAKGVVTAILSISPFIYFTGLSGVDVRYEYIAALFMFITARELVMDAMEIEGDLRSSMKTLAYYIGRDNSKRIGWYIMCASVTVLAIEVHDIAKIFTSIAMIVVLAAYRRSKHDEEKAIISTRIAMALGAIGIAISI